MAFRLEITDFGAFYERTYQAAYRTALGMVRDATLASDVTQESYVAAYQHLDQFQGDAPAQAWLHRIVVNQALAALRRRKHALREIQVSEFLRDAESDAATRLMLLDALGVLSPQQRAAVVLRYYLDYDYATIAHCLDMTATNVGAMLSRALDRMKTELEPGKVPVASTGR